MRKIVAASAIAALLTASAAFGPRANQDDQFRFFWLFSEHYYPALVGAGFNLFIQDYWGHCNFSRGTYGAAAVEIKHRIMDRILADGCDYIEQLPVVAKVF